MKQKCTAKGDKMNNFKEVSFEQAMREVEKQIAEGNQDTIKRIEAIAKAHVNKGSK